MMRSDVRRQLSPVPWNQVRIDDPFWSPRLKTNREVTLPLEYAINRKNGVLDVYQWDWWDPKRGHPPWRIWVGDVPKWIEAASYSLATNPDRGLAARVDDAVTRLVRGQKPDGYLYSNPLPRAWRFANLQELHELYDMGHAMEAAVAHHAATGRTEFLDAMRRNADLLCARFGRRPGQIRGYDGHPEIDLALMKLYGATGERRYLDLAKFYVDERGRKPNYFIRERERAQRRGVMMMNWYRGPEAHRPCQADRPVREQSDAVGHAVRALYLFSGMADVAAETADAGLLDTCRRMWRSIVHRRMYVTGGVGSSAQGEAFTVDYDLPNETAYAETCAAVALVFFAHRMLQIDADGEYADVMERALYNGALSGVSLDGRSFYYANRLTLYPKGLPGRVSDAVAGQRQKWFGCACCPPNIARLLASLGGYAYSTGRGRLAVHLYMGGSATCAVDGRPVTITQRTQYPWRERVAIAVDPGAPRAFTLALRIPGWCRKARVRVNGRPVRIEGAMEKGYACIRRVWARGDRVELTLPMPVERVEANPAVRMDCGKVALQRGPVVYAVEQADNGPDLADLRLPRSAPLKAGFRKDLLGGVVVIRGRAVRRAADGWSGQLYRAAPSRSKPVPLLAVPYALWANRGGGEMIVWLRE